MAPRCPGKAAQLPRAFSRLSTAPGTHNGLSGQLGVSWQSPAQSWVPAFPEAKEAQRRSCLLSNPFEGLSCQEELPPFLLTDKTFQEKNSLILAQSLPGT